VAEISARPAFAPYHRHDRAFFLAFVALSWVAIVMGFGPELRKLHCQTRVALKILFGSSFESYVRRLFDFVICLLWELHHPRRSGHHIALTFKVLIGSTGPAACVLIHRWSLPILQLA